MSLNYCPHLRTIDEKCPICEQELKEKAYNEFLFTNDYKNVGTSTFKEPLTFSNPPPAHNPIQELLEENQKLLEENKKLKETIRILNEKLSKAHRQINRHIEDTYNDVTQNDR
jgi:DNA repair exonuclease SbcCD ATPase subunit